MKSNLLSIALSRRNIVVFDPRYSQNPPFDYEQNTTILPEIASLSPSSRRTAIDTQRPDSDCANPTSLQYMIEEAVTSREEEEDEEEREVVVEPTTDPKPKRKRGRPKLNRRSSEESPKKAMSQRVPHNLVERKYREMLNAELERLRLNVPTIQQHDGTSLAGPSKPSKAVVLAAAVDYIKTLEAEAERLTEENEELKRGPIDYNAGQSSVVGRRRYS